MGFLSVLYFAALVCLCSGVTYEIIVYTGKETYAGTDANVKLTLYGSNGSKKLSLTSNNKDIFEYGSIDNFFAYITDLGPLTKVAVERDNNGWSPGWYVDKFEIIDSYGLTEFACNTWINSDTANIFYGKKVVNNDNCGTSMSSASRIVGGKMASPGAWPWQVTVDHNLLVGGGKRKWLGHWCGGSIINDQWIISAAHCFFDNPRKTLYKITVGQHDLHNKDGYEQEISIEKIILHENYDSSSQDYDIALIKLASPINFNSRTRPVCLPSKDLLAGTECYISGWGALSEGGSGPAILQQAKVPLVKQDVCKKQYNTDFGLAVTSRMLCAGFATGGIDSCQGDSGGPLVCKQNGKWHLMGAVSWGVGCARENVYGVYADIVELKDWILKKM